MKILKFFVFLLLLILTACAESSTPTPNVSRTEAATMAMNSNASATKTDVGEGQPIERKIIRNAELDLESDSPEEAQRKISTIVENKGGFVIESQQSSSDVKSTTRDISTMTVRVPSAKFNECVDEIKKTASRVILETVKGQDVTEEFVDIEARLKAKKALESQFLEIMKQGKTVEDALNIQKEIAAVRGEIEQIEGRKRLLENQSSLSTIKIGLKTPAAFSASSSGFFYELSKALSDGFQAALAFILVLIKIVIAILPFLMLVVLPVYFVINFIIKRNKKTEVSNDTKLD